MQVKKAPQGVFFILLIVGGVMLQIDDGALILKDYEKS